MDNNTALPQSCYYLDESRAVMIAKIVGYALIIFFAAFGNLAIIFFILRKRCTQYPMDIFIVNMSFSGLTVPFILAPKTLYEIVTGTVGLWQVRGTLGNVLCKISTYLVDISPIITTLTLCAITIERFLAVVRPQVSLQSKKQVRVHYAVCIAIWVSALAYCAPYLKLFRLQEYDEKRADCQYVYEDNTHHQAYSIITCILFIAIPFVLMFVMYTCAFIALKTSYKRMTACVSERSQQRRSVRMRSTLKLSIAVVANFLVCWGPYNMGVFLLTFSWGWDSTDTCAFKTYWFVSSFMSTCNAAINPLIYLIFVERFKKELGLTLNKSIVLLNIMNSRRPHSTADESHHG